MRFSVIASLMVLVISVSAALADDGGVLALIRKNYSGTRAVNATFDLIIYWNVREREEKRVGELMIAPGNRFRVTLEREVFVSDGTTFWQYNERNSQVVVRNLSDIDAATVPSALLASFLSNREFEITPMRNKTTQLSWRGDGAEDGYRAIDVVVGTSTGIISSMKLKDVNDNIHTYTFHKTEFDKPAKSDVFQFRAPRGVEVLDMRDGN